MFEVIVYFQSISLNHIFTITSNDLSELIVHYMDKSSRMPDHYTNTDCNVLKYIHFNIELVALFAATTASNFLRRLSKRFWSVSVEICVYSVCTVFMRSGTDV